MAHWLYKVIFLLSFYSASAQKVTYNSVSRESIKYHYSRQYQSTPPYGINKIKMLIAQIKSDSDGNQVMKRSIFNALSWREKFTYNMIHGESYEQNCDIWVPVKNEEKKIYAHLLSMNDELDWSNHQIAFFKKYKDSTEQLITESVKRSKRVGLNYKYIIIMINSIKLIPLLLETYNINKKDHDILTVFMLLMEQNKYDPFIRSGLFRMLYADHVPYDKSIACNTKTEEWIINEVNLFYNGFNK